MLKSSTVQLTLPKKVTAKHTCANYKILVNIYSLPVVIEEQAVDIVKSIGKKLTKSKRQF